MRDRQPTVKVMSPQRASSNSLDRVLVVDDDLRVRSVLASALSIVGYEVDTARDIDEGIALSFGHRPSAIVLDVGLIGESCAELLTIRDAHRGVPLVFLIEDHAPTEWADELIKGGDAYSTKPIDVRELARILGGAIYARRNAGPSAAVMDRGVLQMDARDRSVQLAGRQVNLTPTEFDVLWFLQNRHGEVVTRAELLDAVWRYDFGGRSVVVERCISNLRRKTADATSLIDTIRGLGYRAVSEITVG